VSFPLRKVLKGRLLKIAETQDAVILYLVERGVDFVIHGGTAIWRIYGGKRLSVDVDVYAERPEEIISILREAFNIERAKITSTGVAYVRVYGTERIEVDVTPVSGSLDKVQGDYRLIDGTVIVVWTLRPEALLLEKATAYIERCKARDLYDVYYLLDLCDPRFSAEVSRKLLRALCEPEDMEALRELVLVGLAPTFSAFKRKVEKYASSEI
jgi:predicted nucleotidyltransferase component of viral defense system